MARKTKKQAKKPKTNKILTCPHRKWVDEQLINEVSYRKISEGLKELDPPINASYDVIGKYNKWFFNPEEKLQEILEDESDERLTTKAVDELERIDGLKKFVEFADTLNLKTQFDIEFDSGFTELDVEKYLLQVKKEARMAQREINKTMEHLELNKQPVNFGDMDLMKDPEWIQSKKEAMDNYAARIQSRRLSEFNRD